MTGSSQKGEASIYRLRKRQSTIYGNCNHGLAQGSLKYSWKFSHILLKDVSFGRPNAYNCIVITSKDVTWYGKTAHVERLNFIRGSLFFHLSYLLIFVTFQFYPSLVTIKTFIEHYQSSCYTESRVAGLKFRTSPGKQYFHWNTFLLLSHTSSTFYIPLDVLRRNFIQ